MNQLDQVGRIDKRGNALVDAAERQRDELWYWLAPIDKLKEHNTSSEYEKGTIQLMFDKDDVAGLERLARRKHPDAMAVAFERSTKTVKVLKPDGKWVVVEVE